MVDFNSDVTIGKPAVDIERVLVLQRRENVIEAIEQYNERHQIAGQASNHIIKSRLISMFLQMDGMLNRALTQKEYELLKDKIQSDDTDKLSEGFNELNRYLDKIKLTRIDNIKAHDSSNIEEDNASDGL